MTDSRQRFVEWCRVKAWNPDLEYCAWEAWQAAETAAVRRCAEIAMALPLAHQDDMLHAYRGSDEAKAMAWDANVAIRAEFPEAFK